MYMFWSVYNYAVDTETTVYKFMFIKLHTTTCTCTVYIVCFLISLVYLLSLESRSHNY